MAITNERIRSILSSQATYQERFIVQALMELLESQVGVGTVDEILDSFIPEAPTTQAVMFGRPLGEYSGLSRTKIKAIFKKPDGSSLTDGDVDDIFAAMGYTEGLGGVAASPVPSVNESPASIQSEETGEFEEPAPSEEEADFQEAASEEEVVSKRGRRKKKADEEE